MSDANKGVFISYCRGGSSYMAQAIFGELRARGFDVFMDLPSSSDPGPSDTVTLNQVAARPCFLLICTPDVHMGYLQGLDLLRHEIEAAIEHKRHIVPIHTNGFDPWSNDDYQMPYLAELVRTNTLALYHEYFDEGIARLSDRLSIPYAASQLVPTPPADQEAVAARIKQVSALPAPTTDMLAAERHFYRAINRAYNEFRLRIADYTEAIRLYPGYAHAYFQRGWSHANLFDNAGAVADWTESIRLDPHNVRAHISRADRRLAQGDLAGAIEDYSQAIRLEPERANHYEQRGEAYFASGQWDEAFMDFETELQLRPLEYRRVDLAIRLQTQGRTEQALVHWRMLVESDAGYKDIDWVIDKLQWRPDHWSWKPEMTEKIEIVRGLIAKLD